jgi:hypothetical protein
MNVFGGIFGSEDLLIIKIKLKGAMFKNED